MSNKVLVLGGGMIGSVIARDLAADPALLVTVADARAGVAGELARRFALDTRVADLSRRHVVSDLASGFDLVVGALPGDLGLAGLEAVLEAGRNCCDVSFLAEDPRRLDALAKQRQVLAVYDCGVAPGLSNLLAARTVAELERPERLLIYVGGLPVERHQPFEYKAGFSPSDVIEEYVRPARVVEAGRLVTHEALSEIEPLEFPGVGTLEAFLTDGLRSLADTLPVPDMREKTLRYPGHAALMRAFREAGLFGRQPVEIGGVAVRPLDLTTKLLFPLWRFEEGEADLTALRIVVEGIAAGKRLRVVWDMLDRHDPETGLRSMSRTTAFVTSAMTRLLLAGAAEGVHGVLPPEGLAARPGVVDRVLGDLAARRVHVVRREEPL